MTTLISIPTAPKVQPLLGHLLSVIRDPLAFLKSLPEVGDLVLVRLGPAATVVVCDHRLTQQVLRDDHVFDKGGPLFDRGREVIGSGLITCPHREHRQQRRLVQPVFHPSRLPGYANTITDRVTAVTESWHEDQVLDVTTEMQTITSSVLAATMFSDSLSSAVLQQALDDLATVLGGVYRRMLTPPMLARLPIPGNRRYHQANSRLHHTLNGVIADRRASGADRGDLLSALLSARDSDGGSLGDTEITDQVLTFFAAGTETIASALAWALHLLAEHPDIDRDLRDEVDTVLGGLPVTHADLPRLRLTGRVVTETLRLFPSAWILTRVTTADTRLGEHTLPTGTNVAFSPYLVHRSPDLYPDPDRFDPDRWLPGQGRPPRRDAFIPFGGGARKCIGDQFGITEAVLALATIAARWRLRPLPDQHVRPAARATLRPHRLRMRVAPRTLA